MMSDSTLTNSIRASLKLAMKARDKARVGTLRLVTAEFKRIEVDERIDVDDARALVVLDKMCKQRRDSEQQYRDADRPELAEQESYEIGVIQEFLPAQLDEAEIGAIVATAITDSGAEGMQGMGKVMALVKPKVQGRSDMGLVSKIVKQLLNS
jgi:uncharacterized protein YqeY